MHMHKFTLIMYFLFFFIDNEDLVYINTNNKTFFSITVLVTIKQSIPIVSHARLMANKNNFFSVQIAPIYICLFQNHLVRQSVIKATKGRNKKLGKVSQTYHFQRSLINLMKTKRTVTHLYLPKKKNEKKCQIEKHYDFSLCYVEMFS